MTITINYDNNCAFLGTTWAQERPGEQAASAGRSVKVRTPMETHPKGQPRLAHTPAPPPPVKTAYSSAAKGSRRKNKDKQCLEDVQP
ncbi:hypothetical protein DMENIID0001_115080 [Sergentomyia squamirostris]